MRKKTLSALLCTVAAMAVLTGCGGDKKETAAAPAEGNTTAAVTEAAKTEAETTAASPDRGRRRKESGYAQRQLCGESESSSGGI